MSAYRDVAVANARAEWGTPTPAGASIFCLACHGKGYLVAKDYRGLPYPVKCGGCNGSGKQSVRS